VHIRAEDARSYVGATRERFDVVVGDLVVPWRRGESSLDTRDSFEAVRRADWLYFVGPLDPSQERFRSAPRNRDADPWVELTSPRLHLRTESREATALVGRSLKARLDDMRSGPLAGTVAASLRAEHLEWRERGADIWGASLLSFEDDNAAADRLGLAALARLPVDIQAAVLGPRVPRPQSRVVDRAAVPRAPIGGSRV
jgi:hypothetical protein